jgi:manganese/zinc/iron transport system permease protein
MIVLILIGISLLGIASGLVGSFTFLRKQALIGDSIAHSVFPGVAIGFLFSHSKDPFWLIMGATITGLLSIWAVEYIEKNSKLKGDTSIALVLSVFFGFGVLLFTYIQHNFNASQTGLDKFLLGKAASMLQSDLLWLAAISFVVIVSIILFFRDFLIISFDREYAQTTGIPVKRAERILNLLTILVIVVGVQIVGIVLMAALLVTPASSARFWTDRLKTMLWLSAGIAAVSGVIGVFISMSIEKMPTGPWIVIVLSVIALLSIFFSPNKGMLARSLKRKNIQRKMLGDNILKTFYHLGEENEDWGKPRKISQIMQRRYFDLAQLKRGIAQLTKDQLLVKHSDSTFILNARGIEQSKRIVKLHRLWELYLTTKLNIKGDHVHEDADTIEHFITPELEKELEKILEFPAEDPHKTKIPY